MRTIASAIDPFIISKSGTSFDISGKTVQSGWINGIRNCVLLIAGQSQTTNVSPTVYTPINSAKITNFNIYDGACYSCFDPLLGCSLTSLGQGNFAGRLADKLINANLFDRVILCPIGIGGTTVAQWADALNLGKRITVALARLNSRGMVPSAILWGQGENDNVLGTSQIDYENSLSSIILNSRINGYVGSWLIAQETWNAGIISTAVQNAQTGIVNHALGIYAGPNADSLNASYRQVDNTHWNDAGSDAYASLWLSALQASGSPF